MTSNEILKADVLDILFENRNKQYGAYALRKYYNNRLVLALGLALAAVLFLVLLIRDSVMNAQAEGIDWKCDIPIVKLTDFITAPEQPLQAPPPVAQPRRPVATQAYNSRIEIVADADATDLVPEIEDLVNAQIGNTTVEGDAPTVNYTIEEKPAPPAATNGHTEAPQPGFIPVERMCEFPGGVEAWTTFLGRHLRMPAELEAGERRTVLVKFWVGIDGSIDRFEVVQTAGVAFDNEVIRVLKKMPKWKPAIQNGQPIAVTFTQPVTFQAVEE